MWGPSQGWRGRTHGWIWRWGSRSPGGSGLPLTCPSARVIEKLEDTKSFLAGDDPSASTPQYQVRGAGAAGSTHVPVGQSPPLHDGGDRPHRNVLSLFFHLSIQEAKRVQARGPNTLSPMQSPMDSLVSPAEGLAMLGGMCHRDRLDASRAVPAWHEQSLGSCWSGEGAPHSWHMDRCPQTDLSCVFPNPEGGGTRAAPDSANHHHPPDPISKECLAPGWG